MRRVITFIITTATALTTSAFAYSDVDSSHLYSEAIDYITTQEIVQGYEDGTYKPDNPINRAEFTKILIEAKYGSNPTEFADACFTDFTIDRWFSSYVCYAKAEGIISGYPDGTFGPANNINLAEASKIIVNIFKIEKVEPVGTRWYSEYVETMLAEGYIPASFQYISDEVTRGEMAEMIWRIMEEKHDLESVTQLENSPCQELGEDLPSNINMDVIRRTWLEWYNVERRALDLHEYTLNDQLNRTAIAWSEISEDRGYMDHKREGQTEYYDSQIIRDWLTNLGIEIESSLFVENIAWGMFNCNQADCTDQLLDSIEYSFNFFMDEKGTDYTAHYDSVVSPYYNIIGLGIAVDEVANKYYLTVHYAKAISNNPMRICD